MKNVYPSVLECIGHTPLIRINRLNPNPRVTLYAKLESANPGGSIKDRAALAMINTAEQSGELTKDKIILEATSGNTGIGLAMVAAVKGYRLVLAMPETASIERQKILKALGAELLLTPGPLGTDGAIEEVYRLMREEPERYFMADQFNNPANPNAHYLGTGPEIYDQTDGRVNVVVCALGTSGTAMGLVRAMKERDPKIRVMAVEPFQGHKIQGLKNMKESYMPGIFDRHALDRVLHVKDEDAFETARRLAREEGLFVGMSSGAAVSAALAVAAEMDQGMVVAVLPDGGDRYLSTNLFTTLLEPDFRFFDVLHRRKIDFKPIQEGKVRLFVTGPPIDQPVSLQDSRRLVLADLLVRFLETKGFAVKSAVLMPDLDSRSVHGAIAADLELAEYSRRRREACLADLACLGITGKHEFPAASEYVDAILGGTRKLLNKGFAYEKLRSVYFNLSRCESYGALSRIDPKKVRLGSTVDLDAYEKLNPRDFTLLKRTTLAELKRGVYLKTEWGNVLPTWHIAAVAVAAGTLGTPIDIHLSSIDFLFPHLENVRAIGEALSGKPFANLWLLCEQVWSDRARKDPAAPAGTTSLRELLAQGYRSEEIRYWLLATHYRKPLEAGSENLAHAVHGLRRIGEFIARIQQERPQGETQPHLPEWVFALEQSFFTALADDLNTPQALAALFKFIRRVNPVLDRGALPEAQRDLLLNAMKRLNAVLGLFDFELEELSAPQQDLIRRREQARSAKDWELADRLRAELEAQGIRVTDTPQGSRWNKIHGPGSRA